ncbi:S49 family peptidase [Chlamydiifrater phoenicopteri]|uniref:S49 family peptidase n=1 Tax=Chlamydiifrater phoenicopteri TaxID=2681469 RepID=UPI001FE3FE51|nr:S49 family peptidase [Chlamydiifrater phoenicopteri]
MMRYFFRICSKAFISFLGISTGLFLAIVVLFGGVLAIIGSSSQNMLVSLPDAQGKVKPLGKETPVVAVFDLKGVICPSKHSEEFFRTALASLDKPPLVGRVKGLILKVDCPGGELFEVHRMYTLLREWKERTSIPVYVFIEGLCASGGYYVSCLGDKIFASSVALTGSVGVITGPFFNVKDGLNRHGIKADLLSGGKDKAPLNPFSEWDASQKEERQKIVDFFYKGFVSLVSQHRPLLTEEKLVDTLGARVYPPLQAKEEGFIDEIDVSFSQVIKELLSRCNIAGDYRVVGVCGELWWKKFMVLFENSPFVSGKVHHQVLPPEQNTSSWYAGM